MVGADVREVHPLNISPYAPSGIFNAGRELGGVVKEVQPLNINW